MSNDYAHEFRLDRPVEAAFPLFTPKGEESWVPGWRPRYLQPPSGETCEEMLFVTGEGEEETFWTCLAYQPETWHARYLRVTPASRVAFVDVRCKPEGSDRTRVRVAYQIHALTNTGQAYLEALPQSAFIEMIDTWLRLIEERA